MMLKSYATQGKLHQARMPGASMVPSNVNRVGVVTKSAKLDPYNLLDSKLPVDASRVVGEKVGKWLTTTYDLLTFPARAGTGALVSVPDRLQNFQGEIQRVVELVQDPRPLDEKRDALRQEIEATLLECLEKGANIEQDVLANLKAALPAEAANMLTELIPDPPNKHAHGGMIVPVEPSDITVTQQYVDGPAVTYGQQDVLTSQIASEITEIRNAVAGLKSALEAVRVNTDAAAAGMLKLNLREARDQLQRRLSEVSPATSPDPSVGAATREARLLLEEVNTMFFK